MKIFNFALVLIFTFSCFAAKKIKVSNTEILIVGTLHELEAEHAHQYAPLYEAVKAFQPEVICTEFRLSIDTLSLQEVYGQNYLYKMDSLANHWNINTDHIQKEIQRLYQAIDKKEDINQRMELWSRLYISMQRGNAYFQSYFVDQAFTELSVKEQTQFKNRFPMFETMMNIIGTGKNDEYFRVAFPLAEEIKASYLYPIDDQTLRTPYHEAWQQTYKELDGSSHLKDFEVFVEKFSEKFDIENDEQRAIKLNSLEAQKQLLILEGQFFPRSLSEAHNKKSEYWMQRNENMAKHILNVASQNEGKRIVVFAGCSHVAPIKLKLKKLGPYIVKTIPDVLSKIENK